VTPAARPGMLAALRIRDFALLWSGQAVSALGDGVFTVALVIEVLRVDDRPIALAYVIAARAIPSILLALVGGVVSDRLPRRLVMLTSDTIRGLAVGTIALLVATHHVGLLSLVAMSAIFGAADAFFGPASMSMVPELLPSELLVQGNGLSSTTSSLASSLIGPATGGAIVGLIGTAGSFTADAVSYGVSAACLAVMNARPRPKPPGGSVLADAREGLAFLRSKRWLVITLIAASIANLFGIAPFAVLLPLLVRHVLHASPLALGLVFAVGGGAGAVASLVVARLGSPPHRIVVMWTAYGLAGVAIAAMAAAANVYVVAALSAAEIGLIVYGDVLYVAMMQQLIPNELRGRVFSVSYLLAFVLTPLGTIAGGLAASGLGTRTAILLSGCLSGACAFVIFIPGVRAPEAELQEAASEPDT
jgi:MFS family permease